MSEVRKLSMSERFIWRTVAIAVLGMLLYALFVLAPEWKHDLRASTYSSCVQRGGLITEGPFGISCVGVKEPD